MLEKYVRETNQNWTWIMSGTCQKDNGLCGLSSPLSYLVKVAAKCESYNSDIIHDALDVIDKMNDNKLIYFTKYFGFREYGVDGNVYIETRVNSPSMYGKIEEVYFAIYKLEVEKDKQTYSLYRLFDKKMT